MARAEPVVSAITSLAFSPDGKFLAAGTFGQVVLYDAATWEPREQFRDIGDEARSLAYSPDGKILAIGSGLAGRDGRVTLWQPEGNKATRLPVKHTDTIEGLTFRRDGKGLLACANDNKISYFTDLPGTATTILDEHNGRVLTAAFSRRDNFVYVTGGMDKIVKVWNMKTQKAVANFDQSEGGVTGLAFFNDDNFIGASLDGRLRWWHVYYDGKRDNFGGNHYRTIDAHKGGVNAIAVSADGKRLVSGGEDSVVCVWQADNGNRQREFKDTIGPIYTVAISPDGKMIAAGGRDGKITVWDVEASKMLQTFSPPLLPQPKPAPVLAKAKLKPGKTVRHRKK